jgi:hypothetical protein
MEFRCCRVCHGRVLKRVAAKRVRMPRRAGDGLDPVEPGGALERRQFRAVQIFDDWRKSALASPRGVIVN